MCNANVRMYFFLGWLLSAHMCLAAFGSARAQAPEFVAPPRTIADITAILDKEKPNSAILAKNKAAANAQPPRGASSAALFKFYLERGRAHRELGLLAEAREDGERAVKSGQGHVELRELLNARMFIVLQHLNAREFKIARELLSTIERDVDNAPSVRGRLFTIYRQTISVLVARGDLAQAEGYLRRQQSLFVEARGWPPSLFRSAWEADVERAKAIIADARGRFREAELAYGRSTTLVKDTIVKLPSWPEGTTSKEEIENRIDIEIGQRGRSKANQGRLAEAEADVRAALLSRLKAQGKYAVNTANLIEYLAFVVSLQGRYAEAEQLMRTTLEIRRTVGVTANSEAIVGNLRRLSSLATLQQRHQDAAKLDAEIDQIIKSWEPQRRQLYELDSNRVYSLLVTGRTNDGVAAAQRAVAREISRFGEAHPDVALIRGLLAIGYAKAGRHSEALAEFRKSVPTLLAATRTTDLDESAVVALRNARIRDVIEGYVGVLASAPSAAGPDAASEAFRLIDAVRGRSVQQAVTASAARMVARDKALADLVRRDQDQEKQMAAQLGVVNRLLAQPSGERDDGAVRRLNDDIEKLRAARAVTRAEITRRFPNYAELIDPKPPTVADMRAVLRPGEALVSFYFGREKSFVWALPKDGPMAFATIVATGADIDTKIAQLRKALEPDVDTIANIPEFDVGLASDLYDELLRPVEAGWKDAKSLIVVTNGALGLLPLGLLPRERVTLDYGTEPAFAAYRKMSWLARTHAITQVPSAAALRTLRQLPAGSQSRETLIGFGDPFFSEAQAAEAARETATALKVAAAEASVLLRRRASARTDQIDSADLALLPRLPDTADELKAVAQALRVDPARKLYLGKAAHERAVKTADLARYRIVAFATHGLLPGDLNGLTQPALALTAPKVAGVDGDGLLTMEEILALKLDADWVVLSACNTGAGTSAGAEALSGLGRAFFYAGTRALLITNWSVESASARELVTDIFKRQAADPSLGRGEALRQAMMALVDNGVYAEGDKTLYTYAHPLFWAPYSIIGEGGGGG